MAMSWQKNNSLAHLDFLLRIFLSFGKLFIKAKQKNCFQCSQLYLKTNFKEKGRLHN